jgi:glycine oxidase
MSGHPDVLIVGGGVIGLTSAYYLARQGAAVAVLDQGDLGRQASWAGAGILPPCDPRFAHVPIDRLRALSMRLFPDLSAELRERTSIDNGYLVCGGLEIPEDGAATDEWRSEGISFEEISGPELRRREPRLASTIEKGYFIPEMAQVRNPRHLKALIAAVENDGVSLEPHSAVKSLVLQGGRAIGVQTERGRREAGRVLLTAGAWSEQLLQPLGWRPGVRPIRGQIALLQTDRPGARPILMKGKRYLVPRSDGRTLVGSTMEDAGFDARPTAAAIAGLLEFAATLLPALRRAAVERCWAGLRPGSPDGLPFLGPAPGCDGLFIAAGHFRAGLQLSPATGYVMAELLLGRQPSVPLDAFRLDRPTTPVVEYGEIVQPRAIGER